MNFKGQQTGKPDAYYEPNSLDYAPREKTDFSEPLLKISGDGEHYDRRDDDYGQVTALLNLFDAGQKSRLYRTIAEAMQGVPEDILERQMIHFGRAHEDYEAGVRQVLMAKAR